LLPVTDSMTCIIRVCHVTHISVMSTGKDTIPAKRATIFNPEDTLIFRFQSLAPYSPKSPVMYKNNKPRKYNYNICTGSCGLLYELRRFNNRFDYSPLLKHIGYFHSCWSNADTGLGILLPSIVCIYFQLKN